jgi:hypothetical protein
MGGADMQIYNVVPHDNQFEVEEESSGIPPYA